jgi:hypothetical protein
MQCDGLFNISWKIVCGGHQQAKGRENQLSDLILAKQGFHKF